MSMFSNFFNILSIVIRMPNTSYPEFTEEESLMARSYASHIVDSYKLDDEDETRLVFDPVMAREYYDYLMSKSDMDLPDRVKQKIDLELGMALDIIKPPIHGGKRKKKSFRRKRYHLKKSRRSM